MFQDRIRKHYDKLTPGFRKLADFIMEHTLDAAFLTATELSRRVGVDPATVVRFAQEMDYSGYRELSREIKRYVRDQVTNSYRQAQNATTIESMVLSLNEFVQQELQQFITTNMGEIAQLVEIVAEAPKVWFTGEYGGYDLASLMAKRFDSYGIPARSFHPSMAETAMIMPEIKQDHVLFAVADTSPSLDTGYAVRLAKEKGIKTVTVTCSGVLLSAREANVSLIVPCRSPSGVDSFGIFTLVLSMIWEAIVKQKEEVSSTRQKEAQAVLKDLFKLRVETPEYEVASRQELWNQAYDSEK